jgi:acyl carrier protein
MTVSPAFDETPDGQAQHAAIAKRLDELFLEVLNIKVPSPETDLIGGGLLDSLALVELLFEIEQRFEVDLALEDLDIESFRTLERLASFIAAQTQSSESSAS